MPGDDVVLADVQCYEDFTAERRFGPTIATTAASLGDSPPPFLSDIAGRVRLTARLQ